MVILAVLRALALFGYSIVPQVRRQLHAWEQVAQTIPDPMLKSQALDSLRDKASNAEAAAVFSTLALSRQRGEIIPLLVALQVLTDFLDTISEAAVPDPLCNGMALHAALVDAVSPDARSPSYYRHHPQQDDGGYVLHLVQFCQAKVRRLPAVDTVGPLVAQAARRCGVGQSYTHDARHHGPRALAAWAADLATGSGYVWWEAAAGASSSVALHALVVQAADAGTTREEAALVDAVYCFGIGALTVLLDNLVDRDHDERVGGHSYLAYYVSANEAASRIAAIAEAAHEGVRRLDSWSRHAAILAGVLGFYLSAPETATEYGCAVRKRALARAGPAAWLVVYAMRIRRRIGAQAAPVTAPAGPRADSCKPQAPRARS